ncbi:MAG: methyltransferase domain-containing protein, partial [Oscillospiraceae bacterium]|nr:methyltransferase domain-containing protein [Oscillospiraceae bacterium]
MHLVSPMTHKALYQKGRTLYTEDRTESYPIVKGVPVLLAGDTCADWRREIIEVLLWQFPEKMEELYARKEWSANPSKLYLEYISALLKDKEGILSAVRGYSRDDTAKWIIPQDGPKSVPPHEIRTFKWRNSRKFAAERVASVRNNGKDGLSVWLPRYAELVHASKPSKIVELSTGAGTGTAAAADKKARDCAMLSVDISFACHGNTVAIAKYLGIKDTLLPVCANFWHLPFADESVDAVCSHFGLDESRELSATLAEVSRILKRCGRFINVSRSSAASRSFDLFEPFGFTREEMVEVCKTARLFA